MSLIDPNDPRLTAYALDEMSPRERAAFEVQLRADPAAQAAVDEIRQTAASLSAALEREPAPPSVIEPPRLTRARRPGRTWLHFPVPYFLGGVAAAAIALAFFWRQHANETQARLAAQERELAALRLASEQGAAAEKSAAEARAQARAHSRSASVEIGVPLDAVTPSPTTLPPLRSLDPLVLAPIVAPALPLPPRIPTILPTTIASANVPLSSSYNLFPTGAPAVVTFSKPEEIQLLPDAAPMRDSSGWSRSNNASASRNGLAGFSKPNPANSLGLSGTPTRLTSPSAAAEAPRSETLRAATADGLPSVGAARAAGFRLVSDTPLSAFGLDAEVATFASVASYLTAGQRPPAAAVRIEELVNSFPCDFAEPAGDSPLGVSVEMHPAPWAPDHQLLRLGFRARNVADAQRPAVSLVLVLDISASAAPQLELARTAARHVIEQLRADDQVAVITYAAETTVVVPATPAANRTAILAALAAVSSDPRPAAPLASLQSAFQVARAEFLPRGINRVLLCTTGGAIDATALPAGVSSLVVDHAALGIELSSIVVGPSAVHGSLPERLARAGHGRCAAVGSVRDAERLAASQMLVTRPLGAEDVRVQLEFNPARVKAYRQVGYENRAPVALDAAGENAGGGSLAAGEAMTVLYEIIPVDAPFASPKPATLKYQNPLVAPEKVSDDWLTVNVRYRIPRGPTQELARTVTGAVSTAFPEMSRDFRFTAATVAFGLLLQESPDKGSADWPLVETLARDSLGADATGHRAEFLELVRQAREISAKL